MTVHRFGRGPGLGFFGPTRSDSCESPAAYTLDSSNAYWADGNGDFWQEPIDRSSAPILLASEDTPPAFMAVDATYVYWTRPVAGTVMRCSIGGCGAAPETIAMGQAGPYCLAVDAGGLYWTNTGSRAGYDGSIMRFRPGDDAPTLLVANLWWPELLVLDASYVYWGSGDLTTRRAPR